MEMMEPIYPNKQEKLPSGENQPLETNSTANVGSSFWHRFLLVQGIGWLGGLGMVGSSIVWAQNRTSSDAIVISQIPDTMPKAMPSDPAPEAPARTAPASSRRDPARPNQRSRSRRQAPNSSSVANNNNSYIDPTDYSLGATTRRNSPGRSYEPPSSVVLTERSTGCERVVQGRGIAGSRCVNAEASARTRVRRNAVATNSSSNLRRQRIRDIPTASEIETPRRSYRASRRPVQIQVPAPSYRVSRRPVQIEVPAPSYRVSRRPVQNETPVRSYRVSRRPVQNETAPRSYRVSRRPVQNQTPVRSYRVSRRPVQNETPVRSYQLSRLPRPIENDEQPRANRINSLPRSYQSNRQTDRQVASNQNISQPKPRSVTEAAIAQANIGPVTIAPKRLDIPKKPTLNQPNPNSIQNQNGINSDRISPNPFPNYYTHRNSLEAPVRISTLPIVFPLAVPAQITSFFGWRIHPISGDRRFHAGTDIGAPMGTPVLAAYAGRVAIADFMGGYGLSIVLRHNQDTQETLYGHLSELFVRPGQWVEQGMEIGRVGNTGNSTGPHLHFEVREKTPQGWVAMNPSIQLESSLAQLAKTLQIAQIAQKFNPKLNIAQLPKLQPNQLPQSAIPNRLPSEGLPPKFQEPNSHVIDLPPSKDLKTYSQLPQPRAIESNVQLPEISLPKVAQTTSQLPEIPIPKVQETNSQLPEISVPNPLEVISELPEIAITKVAEYSSQVTEVSLPKVPEINVQLPEMTLPKVAEPNPDLPNITMPIAKRFEVAVPKLEPIGSQIKEVLLLKFQPSNILSQIRG